MRWVNRYTSSLAPPSTLIGNAGLRGAILWRRRHHAHHEPELLHATWGIVSLSLKRAGRDSAAACASGGPLIQVPQNRTSNATRSRRGLVMVVTAPPRPQLAGEELPHANFGRNGEVSFP